MIGLLTRLNRFFSETLGKVNKIGFAEIFFNEGFILITIYDFNEFHSKFYLWPGKQSLAVLLGDIILCNAKSFSKFMKGRVCYS